MNEETEEYVSDEDNSMRDDLNAALEEAGGDYDESVQEVIGEEIAPSEPSETEEQPTEASTPDPVKNEAESAPEAEDADNVALEDDDLFRSPWFASATQT